MNTLYKILILLCLVSMSGCDNPFNPSKTDDKPIVVTEPNDTPEHLIENLAIAYNQKDIDLYKSCLADDFKFQMIETDVNDIGIDLDDDGILDNEWGYQQEIEYHTNLFEEGSSDGLHSPPDTINLSFASTTIDSDIEEGHDGWLIVTCHFNLQLMFSSANTSLSANGNTRFYLKPVSNEWRIAIWRDESNIYK